jgi:hypothetical protein
MFLTDNLPKPKYDMTSNSSLYAGSDGENVSPKRLSNNQDGLVLPTIGKIKASNIIDQIKNREKQKHRRRDHDEMSIPRKNISINIDNKTPTRVRNNNKYQSNERNYSLENRELSN